MIKENGFSLIEAMVAFSIFMSAVTLLMPIISQLQKEQQILSDRRFITIQLQEKLQHFIWTEQYEIPTEFIHELNNKEIFFQFVSEEEFIKGCANWKNAKQRKESICLYGLPVK